MNERKLLIAGVAWVVLIIALVFGFYLIAGNASAEQNGLNVAKDTIPWTQDMKSSDENEEIQIPFYSSIYVKNGATSIDMFLVNPKENDCYFCYTFLLADTHEEIFQSDLIEPGKALVQVTLAQQVTHGTYDLDIQIDTYGLDDQNPLNNAVISTKLIVS